MLDQHFAVFVQPLHPSVSIRWFASVDVSARHALSELEDSGLGCDFRLNHHVDRASRIWVYIHLVHVSFHRRVHVG